MSQTNLWQIQTDSGDFAELCNALYQREIELIAKGNFANLEAMQKRLQSLTYYITRTAHAMTQVMAQGDSPLSLDSQNASWSIKQAKKRPFTDQATSQECEVISRWYSQNNVDIGLVVPVLIVDHIIIDCIDRIDLHKQRLHTNVGGWFSLKLNDSATTSSRHVNKRLLKPNKKIMASACAGHCWQGNNKQLPVIPSLRELLLSCAINWKNFKKPLAI